VKRLLLFSAILFMTVTTALVPQSNESCNLHGFLTFTQGGWGSSSNSTPGSIRDQYFNQVFPNGLIVGAGTKTITLTSAQAVENFLPQGSTPTALTQSYINPTQSNITVFAGQAVALTLNVFFDLNGAIGSNDKNISDLVIVSGPLAGKTVSQLLAYVNTSLGGGSTPYSYSELNNAATKINENFDNGTVDEGYLTCPPEIQKASLGDKVWNDANKNGIQDAGETGVNGVTVTLYDCSGSYLKSTVTDANGEYFFGQLIPGDYKVKFELPSTYHFSAKDQGMNDAVDSDADSATGYTQCYTLTAGENNLTVDAGVYVDQPNLQADLSLVKTVNKSSAKNGDEVSFEIIVSNDGPNDATNVTAKDFFSTGFDFLSASTATGSFDAQTGIWTIGTVHSGTSVTLTIVCKVDVPEASSTPIDLGPAKGFNAFILKDITQPSADTEGKMAVGRDAYLSNYSVGDKLPSSSGTVDVLVVGRNLTFTSGAVCGGNVVYGNSTNLPLNAVSYVDGTLRQDTPIDFTAAATYLQNLSLQLSTNVTNGTTEMQWGAVKMSGSDPFLNIFSVNGADLSSANNVIIDVPNGAVVLVNVTGETVSWGGGFNVKGTAINNVIYNFYETTSLTIKGINVTGSLLAPLAHVNFISGVQNGQMICKSLEGRGQFNNALFIGNIPSTTTLPNTAEIMTSDQNDPDSAPGNGVTTEDDYSAVFVTVENEDGNSQDRNSNMFASLQNSSAVLSFAVDVHNTLLTGTSNGKLYRTTQNASQEINADMNVKKIWSIDAAENSLYVGTESGIYVTKNDGTSWQSLGLTKKDVRSVVTHNGNLIAAVWGEGVFASTDGGTTWSSKNSGLKNLNVQSIVAKDATLLAATYGGGIYTSSDNGNTWNKSSIDCDYIWNLSVASNGTMYAATYGNGVYQSSDNGSAWSKLGDNLKSDFIYSISVDNQGTVFATSLSAEVYKYSSATSHWESIALPKEKVSSVFADPASSKVYAGTNNGTIYSLTSSATGVETNAQVPQEFALKQNYPNPFNPTTTIMFTIAKREAVSLIIYNTIGQEVRTLVNSELNPGNYEMPFNGEELASGVYLYRLASPSGVITKKMIMLK